MMTQWIADYLDAQKRAVDSVKPAEIAALVETLRAAWSRDQQIFAIGNGGSAANASHFAVDLGKGASDKLSRRFRVLSLTDNVAWMTALGNDYSYDEIFSRQLANYARKGDVVITASVSGNSPNLVKAFEWAKAQGALTGPAHSGWGLELDSTELLTDKIPPFSGIGANEYIVDVTHNVPGPDGKLVPAVDFISTVDTPFPWELNIWYHTLNAGYRTRISGETDFPCIYGERVGLGRSYVKLPERWSYEDWCEGIRAGRNYVGDGRSHLMDFQADAVVMGEKGSQLTLPEGRPVVFRAETAARLDEQPQVAIQKRKFSEQPYWHVERARIGASRKVPVELIENGVAVSPDYDVDSFRNELKGWFEPLNLDYVWHPVTLGTIDEVVARLEQRVQRLFGDALPRRKHRNTWWVRANHLNRDSTNGFGSRHNLVVAEKRLTRSNDNLGRDRERGRSLDGAKFAAVSIHDLDDSVDQVVDSVRGIGKGDHRNDHVAVSHLEVDVGG